MKARVEKLSFFGNVIKVAYKAPICLFTQEFDRDADIYFWRFETAQAIAPELTYAIPTRISSSNMFEF